MGGVVTRLVAAVDAGPMTSAVIRVADALVPILADRVEVVTVGNDQLELDPASPDVTSLSGKTGDELIALTEAEDVAGMVVGLRSVAGGPRPAGHVTEQVITNSSVPVVVVPPGIDLTADPLCRVLLPLEGDAGPDGAANELARRLQGRGSVVDTIHVFDRATVPMFWDGWSERDVFAEQFTSRFSPVPSRTELRVGDVAQQILAAAVAKDATLIMIEWKSDLTGAHAPVVRDLLCNAGIPLLLVPIVDQGDDPAR